MADPGEGPRGRGVRPLTLRPNRGPKGRKKFFGDRAPHLSKGLPSPPSLIAGSGSVQGLCHREFADQGSFRLVHLTAHKMLRLRYSGTPPYSYLGNTVTSLLRPLFIGRPAKTTIHFLVKKPSLIRSARYHGQIFSAHW